MIVPAHNRFCGLGSFQRQMMQDVKSQSVQSAESLVAKEKAAEEKTAAEAKRMAKVSISIQFNAMSSFLPPSYGIGEAGGGGHCGPNSLAYIIFGDVAGGPIIRKVLTCIMSDDFLLACSLKCSCYFREVLYGSLDEYKKLRLFDHNSRKDVVRTNTWTEFLSVLQENAWFTDTDMWIIGLFFNRPIAQYLFTFGRDPPCRKEIGSYDYSTWNNELFDRNCLFATVTKKLGIILTPRVHSLETQGDEIGIATFNDYHYMPVVPFGGRLERGTPAPVWPTDRNDNLWSWKSNEIKGAKAKLSRKGRAFSWPLDRCSSRPSGDFIKDPFGRVHVVVPSFGPSTLALRSVKYNSVSIATHASDFEIAVDAQMRDTPDVVAVCHTGDGCTDLNGTRTVNLLAWFDSVLALGKPYPNIGIWCFGQYWSDDSPSNKIEHLWACVSKLLTSVTIPAEPDGYTQMAHLIPGISVENKKELEIQVIKNAMSVVQDCTRGQVVLNYGVQIRNVDPACPRDAQAEARYASYMKFTHSSAKKVAEDSELKKIRSQYRLLLAHLDRRYTVSTIVGFLCHDIDPDQFGSIADCRLCCALTRTDKLDRMLADLKMNNGKFFSPSPSALHPGHFRTLLEEMTRASQGQVGAAPDEFLHIPKEDRTQTNSLFPATKHCPHYGCFSFEFRNPTDANNHEGMMHPGEKAQRLCNAKRILHNKPPEKLIYQCPVCCSQFSKRRFLTMHEESYDHLSAPRVLSNKTRNANALKRKTMSVPIKSVPHKPVLLPPHAKFPKISNGGPPAPIWQAAKMVATVDALMPEWAAGAGARSASYELQMAAVGVQAAAEEEDVARGVNVFVFREVYAGTAQSFRVAPLARDSAFAFRVRALDAHGEPGEWSPSCKLRTSLLVEPELGADSEGAAVKRKERKKVLRGRRRSSPSPSPSKSAEVDEETLDLYAHDSDESFIEVGDSVFVAWPGTPARWTYAVATGDYDNDANEDGLLEVHFHSLDTANSSLEPSWVREQDLDAVAPKEKVQKKKPIGHVAYIGKIEVSNILLAGEAAKLEDGMFPSELQHRTLRLALALSGSCFSKQACPRCS